jgi:AcrR family transcriptional regulator
MLSSKQEELKRLRILKVAKYFLDNGGNIDDLEKAIGIPHSSIQRYLHDKIIIEMLGQEAYQTIQSKLNQNKQEGLISGGQNYAINNQFTKDKTGKFTGSKKR